MANIFGRSIWPSQADPTQIKKYLQLSANDNNINKKITCRWQYFLDNTHALYAQYRVVIELTNLYNILNMMEQLLNDFDNEIKNLNTNYNITNQNILDVIQIISNSTNPHPEYIIKHNNSIPANEQHNYNKVQNLLNNINSSGIFQFLRSSGDMSSGIIRQKINNHITKYELLFYLLKYNIFKTKTFKERQLDYKNLQINSFFSNWWTNYYKPIVEHTKNTQNFSLDSQKNLYTNKNHTPNNNIPTNTKHGFSAFQDVDTTAAKYFNDIILSKADPFILDNTSLNDFFKTQITDIIYTSKNKDITQLKSYIITFKQFHNLFKNISNLISPKQINIVDQIEIIAKNYIIIKN